MKHIVQEVILVIIITVISITVALLIAGSVQSKPLHMKDNQSSRLSETQNIIHSVHSERIRITGIKLKKKL